MRIFTSELETALGLQSSPSARAVPALPVVQLMDSPMVRVPSHINIKGARQIAALKRTRHLLVTEGMHIIGLLWADDWAAAPDDDRVWKWMRSSIPGVTPDTDAQVALQMMDRGRTSFLVVAAGALVLGIVTEGRLRHAVAAARRSPARRPEMSPVLQSAG